MFLKLGKKNITFYAQNYSLCFYLVHAIYSDQNASIIDFAADKWL